MRANKDKCRGVILGTALGDSEGAPFEGGFLERSVWRLIGKTSGGQKRWTDDTQMTLDIAESLIAKRALDLDDIAFRFAKSYRFSRGYGPGAAKTLKRIRKGQSHHRANRASYKDGSFGNGGAMRAALFSLLPLDPDAQINAAKSCAEITHAHPEGIEGAALICEAAAYFCAEKKPDEIFISLRPSLKIFRDRLMSAERLFKKRPSPKEVANLLGNKMSARDSCVTAIFCATHFIDQDIEALIHFGCKLGGDTDTILAMACALWGAANGADKISESLRHNLEQRERLESVAYALSRLTFRRCV